MINQLIIYTINRLIIIFWQSNPKNIILHYYSNMKDQEKQATLPWNCQLCGIILQLISYENSQFSVHWRNN